MRVAEWQSDSDVLDESAGEMMDQEVGKSMPLGQKVANVGEVPSTPVADMATYVCVFDS